MDPRVERAVSAVLATPELAQRSLTAIWIFGSHARGAAAQDSDVDLAILCEPPLGIERPAAIDHASSSAAMEIDLIDLATAPAQLVWEILTTGRLVRELDEEKVERFVRYARYAAEDAWRRDRMILLATTGAVGSKAP